MTGDSGDEEKEAQPPGSIPPIGNGTAWTGRPQQGAARAGGPACRGAGEGVPGVKRGRNPR